MQNLSSKVIMGLSTTKVLHVAEDGLRVREGSPQVISLELLGLAHPGHLELGRATTNVHMSWLTGPVHLSSKKHVLQTPATNTRACGKSSSG